MLSRRILLFTCTAAILSIMPAQATEAVAFTADSFSAAQAAGKPILIDITASWCPTCKAQAPVIQELTTRGAYKDVVVFQVDFDDQKDVVRSFNARMQSTLIMFKGQDEVARSVGVTDPAAIAEMLSKAASGT